MRVVGGMRRARACRRPRAARVCCRLPFGAAAVRRLGLRAIRSRRLRGCAFGCNGVEKGERDDAAEAVSDAGLGFRTSGDPAASGSERGRSARLIGGLLEGRSDPRSGWRGGEGAVPGRRLELQRGRSASFVFGFARNRLRDASQGCCEDPFRNAPSETQRGPCSARALPRARCGPTPRTNVSRETFFSEQSGGRRDRKSKAGEGEGQGRASYVRTNVSRETSGAGRATCGGAGGRAWCGRGMRWCGFKRPDGLGETRVRRASANQRCDIPTWRASVSRRSGIPARRAECELEERNSGSKGGMQAGRRDLNPESESKPRECDSSPGSGTRTGGTEREPGERNPNPRSAIRARKTRFGLGGRNVNPESEIPIRRAGRDLGGWNAFSEGGARPPRARCGLGERGGSVAQLSSEHERPAARLLDLECERPSCLTRARARRCSTVAQPLSNARRPSRSLNLSSK